ncbi:MAG: CBS domain-containing protein [Candidatus Saccharimonadales bacterium]
MTTLLIIVWGILALSMMVIGAIRPVRSTHSWFELMRISDTRAMRRERLLDSIYGVQRGVVGIVLMTVTLVGFLLWQWWGIIATLFLWIISGLVIRHKTIRKMSMRVYVRIEPWLLDTLEKTPSIGSFLKTEDWKPHDQKLESPQQLAHLVMSSGHVFTAEQQDIILNSLDWHTTSIADVMTPKRKLVTIKFNELLGPLVLDDLHKSGYSRFPVIKGDVDNIIGILDITTLLEINGTKKSETAEKAMSQQVLRIESDEPLPVALSLLEKSRQHILIVVDVNGSTVGLVTLTDIMGSLLGKNRGEVV